MGPRAGGLVGSMSSHMHIHVHMHVHVHRHVHVHMHTYLGLPLGRAAICMCTSQHIQVHMAHLIRDVRRGAISIEEW